MLPVITLFTSTCALLTACVILFVYKFYIKPFLSIQSYKRQGGASIFSWELTSYFRAFKYAEEKGDFSFEYKQALKKTPNARFIVENFGSSVTLILADPEMIKEFLRKHEIYQKNKSLFSLLVEKMNGTVIFAEGNEWKRKRKLTSSAFNFEFLKNVVPIVISTTEKHFNEWTKKNELTNINLIERFGMITGEVTGNFFFGKTFGEQNIEGIPITTYVQHSLNDTIEELYSLTTLIFGTKLLKANIHPRHRRMNRAIDLIRERFGEMIKDTERSKIKEKNLLTSLLELHENENEGQRITTDEIIGEFIGLFSAGTDTTSHLLGSAVYFLSKNPSILKKVKEEIDSVFSDMSNVDIENINKMDYTQAFLKETLRLGGPIITIFDRIATQDDDLCGVKVKKGDGVLLCNNLHFTSEKYFSNSQEIIPERWFPDAGFSQDGFKNEPYSFIPFSAGPRNCVGQHLAMIEAKIILALFLKTFDFEFDKDYKPVYVQRFTYEPLHPLLVTLTRK